MELNTENLIKFFKARLEDAKSIDPVADEKKWNVGGRSVCFAQNIWEKFIKRSLAE